MSSYFARLAQRTGMAVPPAQAEAAAVRDVDADLVESESFVDAALPAQSMVMGTSPRGPVPHSVAPAIERGRDSLSSVGTDADLDPEFPAGESGTTEIEAPPPPSRVVAERSAFEPAPKRTIRAAEQSRQSSRQAINEVRRQVRREGSAMDPPFAIEPELGRADHGEPAAKMPAAVRTFESVGHPQRRWVDKLNAPPDAEPNDLPGSTPRSPPSPTPSPAEIYPRRSTLKSHDGTNSPPAIPATPVELPAPSSDTVNVSIGAIRLEIHQAQPAAPSVESTPPTPAREPERFVPRRYYLRG